MFALAVAACDKGSGPTPPKAPARAAPIETGPGGDERHPEDDRPATNEFEALVEQLVNKNPEPQFKPKYDAPPPFPPDYDWHEQARVIRTWHEIHRRAPEMLAILVAHANDERYAVTFEVNKWHNASVGDICCIELRRMVECYALPPGTLQYRFLPFEPSEIVEWWDAHKNQSLLEIQIEMLQRTRGALAEHAKQENTERAVHSYERHAPMMDAVEEHLRTTGKPIIGGFGDFYAFYHVDEDSSPKSEPP